ncbi:hypothetical protein [Kurlavirus BKC-1]|uniref:Uncharacterized protein n=1 Tax=Marseillevirus sp. TaxID=2809551 RepID=A0AA96IY97_9VIRU|nr:hypothetical protein [Kurlavirus BKC-1]WNL50518.1 hypothetical protein MarDSR_479 [Marseillevirus sp.]
MDEIRKAVPWPLLDISTIGCKTYMVLPGITFSYKLKKNGTEQVLANFSGHRVSYRGKDRIVDIFVETLKDFVSSEEKRTGNTEIVGRLLKNIGDLEKERDEYKRKYEMAKGAIEFAPGSEEYENAKKRFYENV